VGVGSNREAEGSPPDRRAGPSERFGGRPPDGTPLSRRSSRRTRPRRTHPQPHSPPPSPSPSGHRSDRPRTLARHADAPLAGHTGPDRWNRRRTKSRLRVSTPSPTQFGPGRVRSSKRSAPLRRPSSTEPSRRHCRLDPESCAPRSLATTRSGPPPDPVDGTEPRSCGVTLLSEQWEVELRH